MTHVHVMQCWRVDATPLRTGQWLTYVQDVASQYVIAVERGRVFPDGKGWQGLLRQTMGRLNRKPEEMRFGRLPSPELVAWLHGVEIVVLNWPVQRTVFDVFVAHLRRMDGMDRMDAMIDAWNRRKLQGKSPQLRFFGTPLPLGRRLTRRTRLLKEVA